MPRNERNECVVDNVSAGSRWRNAMIRTIASLALLTLMLGLAENGNADVQPSGSLYRDGRGVVQSYVIAQATVDSAVKPDRSIAADETQATRRSPGCQLIKIAELPVRLERGLPIVDGAINGQKIGVLFDTGSEVTLITRAATERLRLVLNTMRTPLYGRAGERSIDQAALIEKFEIGNAVRANRTMVVAAEADVGDIAVILGDDSLQDVDVEFDLAHNAVRLFHAKDCAGASLAYWASGGAGQIDIDAVDPKKPAITFKVEVNGRQVRAQLDSGSVLSALTESQAAAVGVKPDSPGVAVAGCRRGFGGKPVKFWVGPFETFSIGDELVRNPSIPFADLWKQRHFYWGVDWPDMLLGIDFLRAHRVLVAHSQRRMYFTHAGGTVFQTVALTPCHE